MFLDLAAVEAGLADRLAIEARLFAAGEVGANDHQLGRAALGGLIGRLGGNQRADDLAFPHPRYSLTHSAGWAVAVGVTSPDLLGIGIDLELDRTPDLRSARFFLNGAEETWWAALPKTRRSSELLRLWTIKEALFKADPANASTCLADYHLEQPGLDVGPALRAGSGAATGNRVGASARFGYAAFPFARGCLSVAILTRPRGNRC
jgi:hypothetical protein